jgi:hypothetical protein
MTKEEYEKAKENLDLEDLTSSEYFVDGVEADESEVKYGFYEH